jgi:predicted Zn finger-like uncharacterized protein
MVKPTCHRCALFKALVLLVSIAATSSFVTKAVVWSPRSVSLLHSENAAAGGAADPAPAAPAAPAPAASFTTTSSSTSSSSTNQQALYGVSLEMPSSYVRCGQCQTVYALKGEDFGSQGRGRRLECSVCDHSWFQSKDRLLTLTSEFEMAPLPQRDLDRIKNNMDEGKSAKFMGEKKLYVGNIAFQCHEDDLYEIFGKCGQVGDVSLVRDEEGRNRGFGFVTMRTNDGGDKAISELDGMAIRGRTIAVRASNN